MGRIGLPVAFLLWCTADAAPAQLKPPLERPGDVRPALPEGAKQAPELALPPLPPPEPRERSALSRQPSIVVRSFRVVGSTVFTDEQLRSVTDPYTNRPITSEDLHELRDRLTRLYVDAGYVNSGAVLPDQDVSEGIVEIRMVEGNLTGLEIQGNRHFRTGYLRERIALGGEQPLDVHRLERALRNLQDDDRIGRVHAELHPGPAPGEAVLRVRVEEASPYRMWIDFDNHEPPSVGPWAGRLRLAHENLTGFGDVLGAGVSITEGYEDYAFHYEIPLNRHDTILAARYQRSESEIVEDDFQDLDITSESDTFALGVSHPLLRTERSRVALSLDAELRRSETRLGFPFSFVEGPDDGEARLSLLRAGQDWTWRDLRQAIAARSLVTVGLDLFGATVHAEPVPDGRFLAWLGQIQWVRRLEPWAMELLLRADVQLATSPLLSLEQFSVGGYASVRGYRENRLVRDEGVVSSAELRVQLWSDPARMARIQIAPFFDIGRSTNVERGESGSRTLSSAGLGLLASWTRHLRAEIYWAEALRDVPVPGEHDLQDSGVHLGLTWSY